MSETQQSDEVIKNSARVDRGPGLIAFYGLPVGIGERLMTGLPNIDPNHTKGLTHETVTGRKLSTKEIIGIAKKYEKYASLGGTIIPPDAKRDLLAIPQIDVDSVFLRLATAEVNAIADEFFADDVMFLETVEQLGPYLIWYRRPPIEFLSPYPRTRKPGQVRVEKVEEVGHQEALQEPGSPSEITLDQAVDEYNMYRTAIWIAAKDAAEKGDNQAVVDYLRVMATLDFISSSMEELSSVAGEGGILPVRLAGGVRKYADMIIKNRLLKNRNAELTGFMEDYALQLLNAVKTEAGKSTVKKILSMDISFCPD